MAVGVAILDKYLILIKSRFYVNVLFFWDAEMSEFS